MDLHISEAFFATAAGDADRETNSTLPGSHAVGARETDVSSFWSAYLHVYTYRHTYLHIYTHTHIHTHTHTEVGICGFLLISA